MFTEYLPAIASSQPVKQTRLDLKLGARRIRKQEFFVRVECVVFWTALGEIIASYYSEDGNGRSHFALETILRPIFFSNGLAC